MPSRLQFVFAVWVLGMLGLSRASPALYDAFVQEDRIVEWWTAFLFAAASAAFSFKAWRDRRLGDAFVALFCFVAVGEEVSWGQRVIGFVPSAAFLERNAQQEANLHNLVEAFGQPKWTLVAVLVAYGLALPVLRGLPLVARLSQRFGLTIPDREMATLFALAIAVLVWYPVRLTGEWVEAMSGALFLCVAVTTSGRRALAVVIALALAALTEMASAHVAAEPSRLTCARAEVIALLADVTSDTLSNVMNTTGRVHRRVHSLWREGDLDSAAGQRFRAVPCAEAGDIAARRQYAVDPWGMAYWVEVASDSGARGLTVYSFGPNRRRDQLVGTTGVGDDIVASHRGPE